MLRRGPGIARLAVGTAVVAGTAGAVQHRQQQKYANQAMEQQQAYEQQQMAAQMEAQQQQIAAMQAAQAAQAAAPAPAPAAPAPAPAPAPAAPAAISMDEKIAQLQQLSELQKAGILTDEEFAAQKAKILGS
jgi:hypothetical protein